MHGGPGRAFDLDPSPEGAHVQEGLAAFGEIWPQDAPPPAITVAFVSDLGPDGALVEIEAVAAVLG